MRDAGAKARGGLCLQTEIAAAPTATSRFATAARSFLSKPVMMMMMTTIIGQIKKMGDLDNMKSKKRKERDQRKIDRENNGN